MTTKVLTAAYLSKLSNANHDGVTQQIYNRLQQAKVSNPTYAEAVKAVAEARRQEDEAYRRYLGKDFVTDDLREADTLEDNYMSAVRNILNALTYLPDTEPLKRKAQMAAQLFKDYKFNTSDGLEAEARKTINMVQQWKATTDYTLKELCIEEWVEKANTQAQKVMTFIEQRVEDESMKVRGEMATARKATEEAIRKAFDVVNALNVLQASTELTELTSLLFSIEDRARLYYLPGGKTGGGNPVPNPSPGNGGSSGDDEGESTPPSGSGQ